MVSTRMTDPQLVESIRELFASSPYPAMRARHIAPQLGVTEARVERVLERLRDWNGLVRRKHGKWRPTDKGHATRPWTFGRAPRRPAPGPWRQVSPCYREREVSFPYRRTTMGRGHFPSGIEEEETLTGTCAATLTDLASRQAGTLGVGLALLEMERPRSWINKPVFAGLRTKLEELARQQRRADIRRAVERLRSWTTPQELDQLAAPDSLLRIMRSDMQYGPDENDPGRPERRPGVPDEPKLYPLYWRLGAMGRPAQGVPSTELPRDPQREEAEEQALAIFETLSAWFLPSDQAGPALSLRLSHDGHRRAWTSVAFALDAAGVPYALSPDVGNPYRRTGPGPLDYGVDEDLLDQYEFHYDTYLLGPLDLASLLGVDPGHPVWTPREAARLVAKFLEESERAPWGHTPDWVFLQYIADVIHPDKRFGKLQIVSVPREEACEFVRRHHSVLPECNTRIMYAIGAVIREPRMPERLVAVAVAGHPSGPFAGDCDQFGTLELSRVAAIRGVKDSRGRALHPSSMLTARMMDLLPISGRVGKDGRRRPGCRFVTYSMANEEVGTTYLSLISKGLRPTDRRPGKPPTGTRAGGGELAKGHLDKIRWMSGPAAATPDWSALRGVLPENRIRRAAAEFDRWAAREDAKRQRTEAWISERRTHPTQMELVPWRPKAPPAQRRQWLA